MRHGVQQMPGALKKQVGLAGVGGQKAEVELLRLFLISLLAIAERHVQAELVAVALGTIGRQKERHVLYGKRVQQPVTH